MWHQSYNNPPGERMSRGCIQTSYAAKKRSCRSLGRKKRHISLPEAENTPGCSTPVKAMDEDITWTKQSLIHILMSHKWWESCKQPGCEIASLAPEFTLSAALWLSYFGHFLLPGWWDEPDWFQSFQGLNLTHLSCAIERFFPTRPMRKMLIPNKKKKLKTGDTFLNCDFSLNCTKVHFYLYLTAWR